MWVLGCFVTSLLASPYSPGKRFKILVVVVAAVMISPNTLWSYLGLLCELSYCDSFRHFLPVHLKTRIWYYTLYFVALCFLL